MKRFHLHLGVEDLDASVGFYSKLFGVSPTVREVDYAKWMLEDPRINFAISTRGLTTGLNHLGFQLETATELTGMRAQLHSADSSLQEQATTACCYAKSNKYWITDPSGIAWEAFHTLESIPLFGEDSPGAVSEKTAAACCVPEASSKADRCCETATTGCCA